MKLDKIKAFAVKQGYKDVEYLNEWRGYTCYEPIFGHDEVSIVGPPLMVMVKDGKIRMSTVAEAMKHIEESE